MHRRLRVADRSLGDPAGLLDRVQCDLHVPRVVERVEDAEDRDSLTGRLLDEATDDVVRVVAIADQVLPAQEHLKRGVRHRPLEQAQSLPRVLS